MKPSARIALIVAFLCAGEVFAGTAFVPGPSYSVTTGGYLYRTLGTQISRNGVGAFFADRWEGTVVVGSYAVRIDPSGSISEFEGPTNFPTPNRTRVRATNGSMFAGYFGIAVDSYTQEWPVVWDSSGTVPTVLTPPGVTTEYVSMSAAVMSSNGFVAGTGYIYSETGTSVHRPVRWNITNPGEPQVLSMLSGTTTAHVDAINDDGIVGGNVHGTVYHPRAVRWDASGNVEELGGIGTPSSNVDPHSFVSDISEDGTTFGFISKFVASSHKGARAVRWGASDIQANELELLYIDSSGNSDSAVYACNDEKYSVGYARNSDNGTTAVRWDSLGNITALSLPGDNISSNNPYSTAVEINNIGVAVGYGTNANLEGVAAAWRLDGSGIDLSEIADLDEDWIRLTEAHQITDTGWISGVGEYDPDGPGTQAMYVRPYLMLVPELGTYGMGDANFDESIDFADLLIVAQNYGTETNGSFDVGDFNLDGSVNFTDLLAIAQNYGDVFGLIPASENPTFESDWQAARGMVPEPGVVGLLGVAVMLRRRR